MFETLMEMLNNLETLGDVTLCNDSRGFLDVTFEDFDGFDSNWNEIMWDYEDEATVNAVMDLLGSCPSDGGFYCLYNVDGHAVRVGYASYDI